MGGGGGGKKKKLIPEAFVFSTLLTVLVSSLAQQVLDMSTTFTQ